MPIKHNRGLIENIIITFLGDEEKVFLDKQFKLIQQNNLLLIDQDIIVDSKSLKTSYSFDDTKTIKFNLKNIEEDESFIVVNKYFKNKEQSLEFIFLHEFGHSVQHSSITQYNPNNDKNFKPVIYYDTKTKIELPYATSLLGNIKTPNAVAEFIYSNLQEAYADMYACYAMYLKDNTTDHLNKVIQLRTSELNKIKKLNPEKVTPYQNIEALNIFQQELLNNPLLKSQTNYEETHQLFQGIALKGLMTTIVNECANNKSFLNDFVTFNTPSAKRNISPKNISNIEDFFDTFFSDAVSYNVLSQAELNNIKAQIKNFNLSKQDEDKHINLPKVNSELFVNLNWEVLYKNREEAKLDTRKTIALK